MAEKNTGGQPAPDPLMPYKGRMAEGFYKSRISNQIGQTKLAEAILDASKGFDYSKGVTPDTFKSLNGLKEGMVTRIYGALKDQFTATYGTMTGGLKVEGMPGITGKSDDDMIIEQLLEANGVTKESVANQIGNNPDQAMAAGIELSGNVSNYGVRNAIGKLSEYGRMNPTKIPEGVSPQNFANQTYRDHASELEKIVRGFKPKAPGTGTD